MAIGSSAGRLGAAVDVMQLGSATQPSSPRCLLLSWLEAL